jgi:hypothetical protein
VPLAVVVMFIVEQELVSLVLVHAELAMTQEMALEVNQDKIKCAKLLRCSSQSKIKILFCSDYIYYLRYEELNYTLFSKLLHEFVELMWGYLNLILTKCLKL